MEYQPKLTASLVLAFILFMEGYHCIPLPDRVGNNELHAQTTNTSNTTGLCCRCTAQDGAGQILSEDLFVFTNTSQCSLKCCTNWNSTFTSVQALAPEVCSTGFSKSVSCIGEAHCYCNTLSYPDRVKCCSERSPQCKFLQAYYPTRPQGLCVNNRTENGQGLDVEVRQLSPRSHHHRDGVNEENQYPDSAVNAAQHTSTNNQVGECPGCSSNPTKAACALIHGCCTCCSVPNPCINATQPAFVV